MAAEEGAPGAPEKAIVRSQRGPVRRLLLNRPKKLNAFDRAMSDLFFREIDDALDDPGTHVIVISGAGRAFCSGADVTRSADERSAVLDAPADMVAYGARVDQWLGLWSAGKPIVAQVHGYCLGMANDLVACCDLVVCGESARFGMPEVREFALPPTLGFWPMRIGLARTKELLFTGRLVDGSEAVTLGLANSVVADDELDAAVDELAQHVATARPELLAVAKQAANSWFEVFGLRAAARGGAQFHAIYHQASGWGTGAGGRSTTS